MMTFAKLRELVTLANRLEAEARKLAKGSEGRAERMREAEGYRVKAMWLSGRITDEAYRAYTVEQLDAATYAG